MSLLSCKSAFPRMPILTHSQLSFPHHSFPVQTVFESRDLFQESETPRTCFMTQIRFKKGILTPKSFSRVGRTARAGKDGRAVLLLTQAESFFLKVNRQFPINAYPASDKILNDTASRSQILDSLQSVEPKSKQKAYSAYLGFMKGFVNKMQITTTELVSMANTFATKGMQCNEVPEMEKRTIAKMGLKGVPGIRYAPPSLDGGQGVKRGPLVQDYAADRDGPSRRLRHQGIPEPTSSFANGQGRNRGGAPGPRDHGMGWGRGPTSSGKLVQSRDINNSAI